VSAAALDPVLPEDHLVLRLGGFSLRTPKRVLWVGAGLSLVLVVLALVALTTGTIRLSPGEVTGALFGHGEEGIVRTVQRRRLPRMLVALLVGGALGTAGALFQSLSRNPLGSPDVIGFTAGAAAGAVVAIVVFRGGTWATAAAAVVGAAIGALLVYLLARRDGSTGGIRLVLVGIGIGAQAGALTSFLVTDAELAVAGNAQTWLAGSTVGRGWEHVRYLALALAVLLPLALALRRRLTFLEMGDDIAAGVGIGVERTRLAAVAVGVVLTGVAVSATGPIAFVALAAPQIVRRLRRGGGVLVGTSFLMGGVLLVGADLIAQTLEVGLRTPTGTIASLLGGIYLIWLLARRA